MFSFFGAMAEWALVSFCDLSFLVSTKTFCVPTTNVSSRGTAPLCVGYRRQRGETSLDMRLQAPMPARPIMGRSADGVARRGGGSGGPSISTEGFGGHLGPLLPGGGRKQRKPANGRGFNVWKYATIALICLVRE